MTGPGLGNNMFLLLVVVVAVVLLCSSFSSCQAFHHHYHLHKRSSPVVPVFPGQAKVQVQVRRMNKSALASGITGTSSSSSRRSRRRFSSWSPSKTPTSTSLLMVVAPVFHMGHSHAHHDHHYHDHHNAEEDDDDHFLKGLSPAQKAQALRRRRRRRVALWLFCALATLGPKLSLAHKRGGAAAAVAGTAAGTGAGLVARFASLTQGDWLTFAVSILAISSADKIRRNLLQYLQKLRGLGNAIVKHSMTNDSPTGRKASTISFLASAQQQQQQKQQQQQGSSADANSSMMMMPDTSDADRVTWIGVVINIILSVGKLTVGISQHSSVLIADAGHSLSDLISDFITLWSVRIARLPPDEDHPYGHTKFEAIGSLFLSLTLLATGLSVGAMAHRQLMPFLNHAATAGGGNAAAAAAAVTVPGPLALAMAGISIASKEWLYRITRRVGEKLNSPVVVANAWHHRSDAYSSVLALLSIAWAMAGFAAADAAAGLLVAGMIGLTGFDILVQSIQQLSDSADLGLQEDLNIVVQQWVDRDPDVVKITLARARQVGSSAFCDVTVETSPELSTSATRAVEERLQRYLVPALSDRTGYWMTATVHAKPPPLIACPLLEATTATATATSSVNNNNNSAAASSAATATAAVEGAASASLESSSSSFDDDSDTATLPPTSLDAAAAAIEEPFLPTPPFELSSSHVEFMVRQQALLLNHSPPSSSSSSSNSEQQSSNKKKNAQYQVDGVTVHYQSPKSVSVDVTISSHQQNNDNDDDDENPAAAAVSLPELQGAAQRLQTALQEQVTEIQSARIYLDLLATTTSTTTSSNNNNKPKTTATSRLPTTSSSTSTSSSLWNGSTTTNTTAAATKAP